MVTMWAVETRLFLWLHRLGFLTTRDGEVMRWRDFTLHPIQELRKRLNLLAKNCVTAYKTGYADGFEAGQRAVWEQLDKQVEKDFSRQ